MSTLTAAVQTRITWNNVDALDLSSITDQSALDVLKQIASGTAVDQCDVVWHDERSINAGANDDLVLSALTQTMYGSTVTKAFAKIKYVLIYVKSTTSGDKLIIKSSVTNSILTPFNGINTAQLVIGADSAAMPIVNKKDGFAVTVGTGDVLRINNPGAGAVTYQIAILGTSA